MEHILSMIGLAKKAGQVEIGEEPVGSAARARHARVILVARDAAPSTVRRAMSFGQAGACLCLEVPFDKDQLGWALGRTSCAMVAVTDIGFAEAIVKKLALADPLRYGPAAERLALKAQRAMERREEMARHERNLRRGKRRPPREPELPPAPPAPPRPPRPEPPRMEPPRPIREAKPSRGPVPKNGPARKSAPPAERPRFSDARPVHKGKGSGRKPPKHK